MITALPPKLLKTSASLFAGIIATTAAFAQSVTTSQSSFTAGQPVQVSWTGAASTSDWIGIYPQGVTPGSQSSTSWIYTSGTKTKPTVIIPSGSAGMSSTLPVGNYSIYLCANDGYSVRATNSFSVAAAPSVSAPTAVSGTSLVVNYSGAPGNGTDWIGVYQQGQSGSSYVRWVYLNGATSGSVSFYGLASGNYDLKLYSKDSYTVVAQGSTAVVPNALSTTNPVYSDNESAGYSYNYTDTLNDHTIALYAEGAANTAPIWTLNVGGTDSGSGSVTPALAPGRYELRSFKTGTYDKVGAAAFLVRDDHRQATWVSLPNRNQTHAVGAIGTQTGYADQVWKAAANQIGTLSSTTAVRMRAGSYNGIVQIVHALNQVKTLGKLQALVNGVVVAEKDITSDAVPALGSYDCLYFSLPFTVPAESDVTLRVTAQGNGAFATGVMSLFRTTEKRPLHVIAHRKNNIQRVNTAVAQGATGVEIDISTVSSGGQLRIDAHHHQGEVDWTPHTGFGALLDTVKGHMDSNALTLVYFDVKDPQSYDSAPKTGQTYTQYATELYTLLAARGFDPSRVVVGTFQQETFRAVAQSMNFPVNIDSYYWNGGRTTGWIKDAEKHSTLQEFGPPESSTSSTQDLTSTIYNTGKIRTGYVWTFTNDPAYYDNTQSTYSGAYSKTLARRMLVLGVNGVMPDECSAMAAIAAEPAFQGIFRPADTLDRVEDLHGEE